MFSVNLCDSCHSYRIFHLLNRGSRIQLWLVDSSPHSRRFSKKQLTFFVRSTTQDL
jgi:hypothetical protein